MYTHNNLVLVSPMDTMFALLIHTLQRQNAAGALAILQMFGLEKTVEHLRTIAREDTAAASGVHNLLNIISLETQRHRAFNRLQMAFEPVANEVRPLLTSQITLPTSKSFLSQIPTMSCLSALPEPGEYMA